jgi:hypothetical protein
VELAWDFAHTLSKDIKLPETLQPVEHLELEVTNGRVHVSADTVRLAVTFRGTVRRSAISLLT